MKTILTRLITKEIQHNLGAILEVRTCTHEELSVIEVRYITNHIYHSAISYFTDSWISAVITGPETKGPVITGPETNNTNDSKSTPIISMNSIEDIAVVRTFVDYRECTEEPWITPISLSNYSAQMNSCAEEYILSYYKLEPKHLYKTTMKYTPTPAIVITLVDNKSKLNLLGTVAVSMSGDIRILYRVDASKPAEVSTPVQASARASLPLLDTLVQQMRDEPRKHPLQGELSDGRNKRARQSSSTEDDISDE